MLVSLLTATFNRTRTLPRAFASVQAQTFGDWQHIVINDGSTDASHAQLDPAHHDARRIFVGQANGGCIAALNRAARLADGELIAFLDSDDELLAHHLGESVRACADGADLVWGGARASGPEPAQYFDDLERPGQRIHLSACCLTSTIVMRRSVWEALAGFRDVMSHDADLKARALHLGARVVRRESPSVIIHCEGSDRLSATVQQIAGQQASLVAPMPAQALVAAALG